MVIDNFDVDRAGCAVGPLKANPPLVIDTDAILALPIALQCFQPVAGQGGEIFQTGRRLCTIYAARRDLMRFASDGFRFRRAILRS